MISKVIWCHTSPNTGIRESIISSSCATPSGISAQGTSDGFINTSAEKLRQRYLDINWKSTRQTTVTSFTLGRIKSYKWSFLSTQ